MAMKHLQECQIRRHDVGDRSIFVLDHLFDAPFVEMMYHFMNRLPFGLSDYDTEETKAIRHWKHEFDLENLPSLPLLVELRSRVVDISDELYPLNRIVLKRMHCNMHLYGDMQNPHTDTDLAGGVTALYFANPVWEMNWMGETVFCSSTGEPLHCVIPKPGRLVVFNGDILHRGGVPSRYCFEPRISVAFKFLSSAGQGQN
jgi:SM-20-related protein